MDMSISSLEFQRQNHILKRKYKEQKQTIRALVDLLKKSSTDFADLTLDSKIRKYLVIDGQLSEKNVIALGYEHHEGQTTG